MQVLNYSQAASEVAASAASVLERPQWTVYQICAGEVVWPSGEDGDEDDEDELDTALSSPERVRRAFTPGRNDPCWCGSGKKYKKCHLDADALA